MTRQRGFAMVGALLALLLAAIFGATMVGIARTELVLVRDGGRFATALAALDECASRVARALPLGWDFGDVLAGPDAVAGTPDDGTVSAPPSCVATVRPLAGPSPRILLDLEATRGGGRRLGSAVVGRARAPGPAALLWLDAGARAGRVAGTVVLDGRVPDAPSWAAAAAPDGPETLDAWIGGAAGRVDLRPATGAPVWSPAPPLTAVADAARAAGPAAPATGLVPSAPAAEALTMTEGDLTVSDARWSRGVLVVTGRLRVATGGTLATRGLVVALGGIEIAPGGGLDVRGAVWSGTPLPGALDVTGRLQVAAAPDALARGATMLTLPHEPRLLGWLDR